MSQKTIGQLRKRKGKIVDFSREKIINAIFKATESVGQADKYLAEKLSDEVIKKINDKFHERSIPAVEEIQDIVEEVLIENKRIKIAKTYILYRDQRARLRDMESMVNSVDIMEDYLKQADWRVKENSNMSYSLQGLNNHLASIISSNYWLSKVYTANIRNAHKNGDLHIHDLQLLAPYCAGWDLRDLLIQGFTGVSGKVESKPPKHFRTALGQIINFFYTLQGEVAGAEAFSNFDTYLAPFIRYDKLTYKEVKQAMQEFLFNINVPTRVGFQTPFTNITMDVIPTGTVAEENIIIGGEIKNEKYKDFQKEIDMINIAFAESMMDGDAKGRVFTFPIPTYNITEDFDWDSEVATKVFEMTAKYGIPYFSNFINSDMSPEDARSMCCRLRLDNRELKKRGGGLFGANPLTGSIGVVTVNLPRIGYLSESKEEFFERLLSLMQIARESLEIKRKMLEKLTDNGLYPYARHYLSNIKKRFGKYWQNHFSTIGLIGMNEAMLNFKPIGEDITSEKGKSFALEIMDFMREKIMDYQNSTNNLYNLEATPAEGATRRLANIDLEKYPDIVVANMSAVNSGQAAPYYTNSTQLPVDFTDDLFTALDVQDDFQTKYTGGTVLHGYMGEALPSAGAVKKLIKAISYNYRLPYFTITPTFSICPIHGYIAGEHQYCPICDEEIALAEKNNVELLEEEIEKVEELVPVQNAVPEIKDIEDLDRDIIEAMA